MRLCDGVPELVQQITVSTGSVPSDEEQKPCLAVVRDDFACLVVPASIRMARSLTWSITETSRDNKCVLLYATKSDVVQLVVLHIRSLIKAMNLDVRLHTDLGFNQVRPDIAVVTLGNRLVGVIEVKKDDPHILDEPTVLGELFDQLLLVQGFYASGPVLGILTTFTMWRVVWFPADHAKFTACNFETVQAPAFVTPAKQKPVSNTSLRTPSQQAAYCHAIHVQKEDEREIELPQLDDRRLYVTRIYDAHKEGEAALGLLYTALWRMAHVAPTPLASPTFVFRLTKDSSAGITWHALKNFPTQYKKDATRADAYPRRNVKHLLAIEDLGRGSSGKVWLMSTASVKPAVCVLKFGNRGDDSPRLWKEHDWWNKIYPEFSGMVAVERWSGPLALRMPHFAAVRPEDRAQHRSAVCEVLHTKFGTRFVHKDVRWENIGLYKKGKAIVAVLFDLESVVEYSESLHKGWVERDIAKLYQAA